MIKIATSLISVVTKFIMETVVPPTRSGNHLKMMRELRDSSASSAGCCVECPKKSLEKTLKKTLMIDPSLGEGEGETGETGKNEKDLCPICLDPMCGDKLLVKSQCGHWFCAPCINAWKSNDRNDCPVCRKPLEAEAVDQWKEEYLQSIKKVAASTSDNFKKYHKSWDRAMLGFIQAMFSLHYNKNPADLVRLDRGENVKEIYRDNYRIGSKIPIIRQGGCSGDVARWDPMPMDYTVIGHKKLRLEHLDDVEFLVKCVDAFSFTTLRPQMIKAFEKKKQREQRRQQRQQRRQQREEESA